MTETFAIPCAAAIIEREIDGVPHILVQTRMKETGGETNGMLEIPAGKIRVYECVFDTLRREIREETGLILTQILGEESAVAAEINGTQTVSFTPFSTTQNLCGGYSIVVHAFRCTAAGEPLSHTDESRDIRWMSVHELRQFVDSTPDRIFFMHVTTLRKYLAAIE